MSKSKTYHDLLRLATTCYDLLRLTCRTESSSTTRGRRFATTNARIRWSTSALIQETQQCREILEESRIAQSAAGPDIDRLRLREEDLFRRVRRHDNDRAKIEAL